jgi:hypothetical protein
VTRTSFALLAAAVTAAGLVAVVVLGRLTARLAGVRIRAVAWLFLAVYAAALWLRPDPWPVIDVAVLTGATGGALLIARGLSSAASVAAFLIVAAVIDVVSMSGGATRFLLDRYRDGTSDLLQYLTLVVPVRARIVPIVGIGDLIVGGAAALALLGVGLRPAAVLGAIVGGLLAALSYGLWRGGAPAIPFIAVAVLVLVWAGGRPRRRPGSTIG